MPLTDSRGQGVPYSVLSDKPNAQTLGKGIVDALVDKVVMTFASATVRGATIPAPTEGMVTYLKDTDVIQVFNGTEWRTLLTADTAWTDVTLENGWSSQAGGWPAPRLRRNGNVVHLEGHAEWLEGMAIPPQNGRLLGYVPLGFRPANFHADGLVTISSNSGDTPTGRVEINKDTGAVQFWTAMQSTWFGFNATWFVN
ncbi:hypothetical protein ABZY06_33905 [Streptomyces sp. NPDC006540]|uniref:hypothetical protein n=1 Tax=Streptomyces sp. NPDC006540 TaxID=3155353 RepID=UPI0033BD62BF